MDNVIVMQVVHRRQDFLDRLGCILLCEFAVLADAVEKLSASSQLGHDVVLVLPIQSDNRSN